jgi:hypothetical protein
VDFIVYDSSSKCSALDIVYTYTVTTDNNQAVTFLSFDSTSKTINW